MLLLVQAEIVKLKRYHMVWAGVLLMLLSVLLTLFSATALDGTVWTFPFFAEQVIKNNVTLIFPMCIALIAGYVIAREDRDGTLKNLLTVPVDYRRILCGKLLVCALLSLLFGLSGAGFTVLAGLATGFPGLCAQSVLQTVLQMTLNCLFLYVAVLPVIAGAARMPGGRMAGALIAFVYGYGGMFASGNQTAANLYPVTASLGLIDYRSYDPAVHWNRGLCALSLAAAAGVCALLIGTARRGETGAKRPPSKTSQRATWSCPAGRI